MGTTLQQILIICSEKEYEDFKNNKLYIKIDRDTLFSLKDIQCEYNNDNTSFFDEWLEENNYLSYDKYNKELFEYSEKKFKKEYMVGLNKIIIFGKYGIDI